jgi:RsiW-degrading membrane proteinase PrsW (M82 family)
LFSQLTGFVFGVELLEETCKALPLIIFGLRKKTITGIREGVFLGFLSGLGFVASEGVTYTVRATAEAIYYGSATGQVITFLDRAMSGPLQHSAWAGVVGWFIGVGCTKKRKEMACCCCRDIIYGNLAWSI